jgi:ATP-dependent helicase HrpA
VSSHLFEPDIDDNPYKQPSFDALPFQQWPDQWHASKAFPTPQSVAENEFHHKVNDEISFAAAEKYYRLGDPTLPIAPYREFVLETVENYQSAVLSSATGSGKSSQLGLYLLEAGVPRVFVSSPRILAARELKERAQHSLGQDYEHLAGYLTGNASDSDCGPDTRLIYVTEQLLFKMVNRGELQPQDVVINDEAHERTVGTVALLGLMKEIMSDEPDIKLLISSATIDTQKFSNYLTSPHTRQPAPILILPGRTHPIQTLYSDQAVAAVAREHMQKERNVLAFQPGITRLQHTANQMGSRNSKHTVHLLYGDQSPNEQAKALNPANGEHVVSSRIGETSITPQGKDVVIDSGLSNIGRYEQGVRVLETIFSSKATMEQRKGRVGRTKPGVYVVATPDDVPAPPKFKDRDEYDIPAMETSSVSSYLIELLADKRRLEHMDLLENPTQENLKHDYQLLKRLGAVATQGDELMLTEIGRAMTNLPLDVPLARMLVEARSIDAHYEVDTTKVRLQVAAITAIAQVNGILNGRQRSERKYLLSRRGDDHLSKERASDALFSLDVFVQLLDKQEKFEIKEPDKAVERFEYYLQGRDILVNRYYKARRTFEELCRREGVDPKELTQPSQEERKAIIGCQIAGTEELFVQNSKLVHHDIRGQSRRLGRRSTIDPAQAQFVVGTAFDLRGLSIQGRFENRFISNASAVRQEQLITHAPHRITRKKLGYAVNKEGDFVERQALYFDGELHFSEDYVTPEYNLETREFIIRAMMTGIAYAANEKANVVSYQVGTPNATRAMKQWEKAQELDNKSPAKLMTSERYNKLISKIIRDSVARIPLDVIDPRALDEVIPPVFLNSLVRPKLKKYIPEILRKSPDAIQVQVNEEQKMYLPVSYRHNIAYITIPRGLEYSVSPETITAIAEYHPVKLRIGKGIYQQSELLFKQLEERRQSPKRQKRLEHKAELAAHESTPESLAKATERLKLARKRQPKPKQSDQQIVSMRAKKQTFRQRKPRSKTKEVLVPKGAITA